MFYIEVQGFKNISQYALQYNMNIRPFVPNSDFSEKYNWRQLPLARADVKLVNVSPIPTLLSNFGFGMLLKLKPTEPGEAFVHQPKKISMRLHFYLLQFKSILIIQYDQLNELYIVVRIETLILAMTTRSPSPIQLALSSSWTVSFQSKSFPAR